MCVFDCVIFFGDSVILLLVFHCICSFPLPSPCLFISLPFLLADVLPPSCDLRSYEFESGGSSSGGQHMGSLQQSVAFWESIGSCRMVLDWIRFWGSHQMEGWPCAEQGHEECQISSGTF